MYLMGYIIVVIALAVLLHLGLSKAGQKYYGFKDEEGE